MVHRQTACPSSIRSWNTRSRSRRIDVVEGVESTCEVDLKADTLYRVDVKVHGSVFWSCPGFSTTTLTNLGPKIYAGFFSSFFLVPAHTTQLGGYAAAGVTFDDPRRTQQFTTTTIDHFMFPIERRELDEIWFFKGAKGVLAFLTVPPGIARAPEELLVPSDLQIRLPPASSLPRSVQHAVSSSPPA